MDYIEFLKTKEVKVSGSGYQIDESELNTLLFSHQKFCVKRAIEKGDYLIGASTGMGKTLIALEIADKLTKIKNKNSLILAPLAIVKQTKLESEKFGYEILDAHNLIKGNHSYITNYEKIDHLDLSKFDSILIDEGSILKNSEGKTSKYLRNIFQIYGNNFSLTATPSPNKFDELGCQAEFLKVIKHNQFLAKFFTHDGGDTSNWIIRGWAKKEFWRFVSKWGIIFSHPRDLGFEVEGYDLPKLNIKEIIINSPVKNNLLFNIGNINAMSYNQELRDTFDLRMNKTIEIVKSQIQDSWFVSINHNQEGLFLVKEFGKLGLTARDVAGSGVTDENGKFLQGEENKANALIDFANGKYQILISKDEIASFGLNFQKFCNNTIITGKDFGFERTFQWIKRIHRFGQKKEVNCYIITTDSMQNTIQIYNEKEHNHNLMQKEMSEAIIDNIMHTDLLIKELETKQEIKNDKYWLLNGDCNIESKKIPAESVHFSIWSPPFPELYTYSDNIADLGNCRDFKEFNKMFEYVADNMQRVMMLGRVVAIHCMDIPLLKSKHDEIGLYDFSGQLVDIMNKHGFVYEGRTTIWKNPVVEQQRTKAKGLLMKNLLKDSAVVRTGHPDYILKFTKRGDNPIPIVHYQHENSEWANYIPYEKLNEEQKQNFVTLKWWQNAASPVWMDIEQGATLNNYKEGRIEKDVKHICPLQLPVIERCVKLWTNPGESVLSMFGGIGSEGYQALKMLRNSISIELKEEYFRINEINHRNAITVKQLTLF